MAAASQLACRAGPAIYITLAFHRSPLTRRCLGPRPGGPRGSWSHSGSEAACEALGLGSPGPGEGQDSSLLWAQPEVCLLPARLSWRKEGATRGPQPLLKREGFQVSEVPHAPGYSQSLGGRGVGGSSQQAHGAAGSWAW